MSSQRLYLVQVPIPELVSFDPKPGLRLAANLDAPSLEGVVDDQLDGSDTCQVDLDVVVLHQVQSARDLPVRHLAVLLCKSPVTEFLVSQPSHLEHFGLDIQGNLHVLQPVLRRSMLQVVDPAVVTRYGSETNSKSLCQDFRQNTSHPDTLSKYIDGYKKWHVSKRALKYQF